MSLRQIIKTAGYAVLSLWVALYLALPGVGLAAPDPSSRGPQGPTGPQGIIGPQTPTGPQGEIGPQASTEEGDPATADNSEADTTDSDSTATTDNTVNIDASTGDTAVNGNTEVDGVESGDINSNTTIVNDSNSELGDESSAGSQTLEGGDEDLVLTESEDRSLLGESNTSSSTEESDIVINDSAETTNDVEVNVSTGNLDVSDNTVVGDIATGDINLGVNLINLANLYWPDIDVSIDTWSILGDLNGDLVIPGLHDLTDSATSNSQYAALNQQGQVQNNTSYNTSTGDNDVASNSTVGDIETGSTTINQTVANVVNTITQPFLYIVNVLGDWTGSLLGGLTGGNFIVNQIGPDSQSSTDAAGSATQMIDADSNAQVTNNVNVNASTGYNQIRNNTAVGDIKTGDIKVAVNSINILNAVGSGLQKFKIGIINIFGSWRGNATTAKTASPSAQTDETSTNPPATNSTETLPNTDTSSSPAINDPGQVVQAAISQPFKQNWRPFSQPPQTTEAVETSSSSADSSTPSLIESIPAAVEPVVISGLQNATDQVAKSIDIIWYFLLAALGVFVAWTYAEKKFLARSS